MDDEHPLSPSLAAEGNALPTACARCPAAIWFKSIEWHCFCNIMKRDMPVETQVFRCDGKIAAIAALREEQTANQC